jgi:outer membrane protein assembly factor BamC
MSDSLMVPFRLARLVLLVSFVTACSTVLETDKVNYKSDTEDKGQASLEVPPDLSKINRNKRYEMPNGKFSTNQKDDGQPAGNPDGTVPLQIADIEVKRSGNQMWLDIGRPPEELWPVVRDFWKESGFILTREDQKIGVMETDWAENRAKLPQDFIRRSLGKLVDSLYSTGERDKFRIRLERLPNNHTELFVSHRGLIEVYTDALQKGTTWQPRPSDSELEKEFLRRIMVKLAPATANPEAVLEKAAASNASKLISINGSPAVAFNQSLDIAWRRVGVALDRNGFTVEDRDRKLGIYFVRYVEVGPEGDEGFFSKWFGKSKAANQGPKQYRLKLVSPDSSSTHILILNSSGEPDTTPIGQKIAQLLVNELQ